MNNSRTIAFHYFVFGTGGGEAVTSLLIKRFVANGNNVILFTDTPPQAGDQPLPEGVIRIVLPSDTEGRSTLLRESVNKHKIDAVIYSSWLSKNAHSDCLAIQSAGAAFIYHPQGTATYFLDKDYGPDLLQIMTNCALQADAIAALSPTDAELWKILSSNSFAVTNPIREYLAPRANNEIPRKRQGQAVVWIGRFDPLEKRPDLAVTTFEKVHAALPEAKLIMVGGANPVYEQEVKNLAANLGVESSIDFVGATTSSGPYLENADVCMITSPTEGFSLVLAEAQNAGIPVACFELPNCELAKTRGVEQAAWNDTDALAEKVIALLACDDAEYEAKSEAAYKRCRELCEINLDERWEAILQAALAHRKANESKIDLNDVALSLTQGYYRLSAQYKNSRNDAARLTRELQEQREQNRRLENSLSFKIGRAITALPRSVRNIASRK